MPTPLVDAWWKARTRTGHSMQVPGHKGQYAEGIGRRDAPPGADLIGPLVRDDIAMQGGVDDNAYSGGFLDQAEALWASSVGADHARFLVGGSSQGNIAALVLIGGPGKAIAVDRTSHRSALSGLVISGSRPSWVYPRIHPELGLPLGVDPASLGALADEVSAVFVTAPTYVGTIADVVALAEACHANDRVLAVDQAWGAHLGFMPGRGAFAQGADLVVTSVHKALMGYSQAAVVGIRGDRLAASRLSQSVDLTATTSASGTLLASIDACRAVMDTVGPHALQRSIEQVEAMRTRLRQVPGLVVVDEAVAGVPCDPLKLTLWLPRTGVNGVVLAEELWSLGHGVETADLDSIVMTMTLVDDAEFCRQVTDLLVTLVERHRQLPRQPAPAALWQVTPEIVMTPREAFFAPRRRVSFADAVGEVSAEQFCPYPPGVPLLAPGERVTADIVRDIQHAGETVRVAYCSDPSLQTMEVVA
jgi:lysine decarboxylase